MGFRINTNIDAMDAQRKTLASAREAASKSGNTALVAKIDAAQKAQDALFHRLTANYKNGEDSIQFPGQLREDVPRSGFGAPSPPTPALLEYAQRFDREFAALKADYHKYVTETYDPLAAGRK